MQGERNSGGSVDAKLHVTCLILLLVLGFTASWSVEQGNCEAKPKPKKQQMTYPAAVAVISLPTASCHHLPTNTALSPPHFPNLPYHGASTAASSQGQQEAFDILWKLLKIDALHRAQEVSPAEGDEAESLCGAASHIEDLPRSVRVEVMPDTEGRGSSPSLKRRGPPELTVDEVQEQLGLSGDEEAEDTSSGRTPAIKAGSSQHRSFPSLLQVKRLWAVNRGLFVASCR